MLITYLLTYVLVKSVREC